MTESPQELFIRNWNVYRKVVAADYMNHAAIGAKIKEALTDIATPVRVLDAGCGDATLTLGLLKGKEIGMYTGIDLSAPALELAKSALQEGWMPYSLEHGAIEERIPAYEGECDLLHMSFVLHHLPDALKEKVIHDCAAKLKRGGLFILVDAYRKDGQSREAYLDSYMQRLKDWISLTPAEIADIESHIRSFDFPALLTDMEQWLKAAGFRFTRGAIQDTHHQLHICTK